MLNSKLAEECEEHQALTKKLIDDNRMTVQSQLDDMRRTFQAMFDDHSKTTERLIEEHRKSSEQRLQEVLQTCQRLETQVEQTIAEERVAVQSVLQSVAQAFQRERTQRHAELQQVTTAFQGGLLGDEPLSNNASDGERPVVTQGQLDAACEGLRREFRQQLDAASHANPALPPQRSASFSEDLPPNEAPRTVSKGIASDISASEFGGPPPVPGSRTDHELVAIKGDAGGRDAEAIVPASFHGLSKPSLPPEASGRRASVEVCDPEEEFSFTGSIWDAAVFIGCPQVGACGSAFTAFMLLLNIGMQAVFCLIVNDNMTLSLINSETVQDYRVWRTTIAHNVKFVDSLTYRSLARKVCSFRDAPLSSGPIIGLDSISQYRPHLEDHQYRDTPPLGYWFSSLFPRYEKHVGELMCGLSVVVWWFAVLKEIYSIGDLLLAIFSVRAGRTRIAGTSGGHALVTVSLPRKAVFCTVIVVRSIVCVSLAVCGTFYLAATLSLGDLLLNALALEIVLSLDELTFDVLAPRSVRLLISSMAPLAKPRSRAWRGLDGRPVFALAFMSVAMYSVFAFILREQSSTLEKAREELCGGNQDFIATIDNTGLVTAFNPGADYHEKISDPAFQDAQYEFRAFRSLIENESDAMAGMWEGSSSDEMFGFSGSRYTVEGKRTMDVEDSTIELNIFCTNLDYPGSQIWPTLAEILNSLEIREMIEMGVSEENRSGPFHSCWDVAHRCYEESTIGTRVRQFCPRACGCDHLASPLALLSPEHGCPRACTSGQLWLQNLGEMTCSDFTANSPRIWNGTDWYQGTDLFQAYITGLRGLGFPGGMMEKMVADMEFALYNLGCEGAVGAMTFDYYSYYYDAWEYGNLCEETNVYGFRPITAICPVACRCQETHALLCPSTC